MFRSCLCSVFCKSAAILVLTFIGLNGQNIEEFQNQPESYWSEDGLKELMWTIRNSSNCTANPALCSQCLTAEKIKSIISPDNLTDLQTNDLSIIIVALLTGGSETCSNNDTSIDILRDYMRTSTANAESTEEVLHRLSDVLISSHREEDHHMAELLEDHEQEGYDEHKVQACFGLETLQHEVEFITEMQHSEASYSYLIINHLLKGDHFREHCEVTPTRNDFYRDLESKLKHENETGFDFEEVESLLNKIGIGGKINHTEDKHENHDHKRSIPDITVKTCLSGEELIEYNGVHHGDPVSKDQLYDISLAAVQQLYGGYCEQVTPTVEKDPVPLWESYGVGTASVLIISLLAVLGGLLFPCLNHHFIQDVLTVFIGLAVGTMCGDALLHLIPKAIGIHEHSAAPGVITVEDYTWKMLVVIGAIYVFFLFENLMSKFGGHSHLTDHGHSHQTEKGDIPHAETLENIQKAVNMDQNSNSKNQVSESTNNLMASALSISTDEESNSDKRSCSFFRLPTVAYMIIVGDVLHNFVDGMAIGAAFASGWQDGLTISIAVLCHELPHELGDFAVLLATGLKPSQVLIANTLSACCAFIGLYIGIPISSNEVTRNWIFSATAGMFLYVSLVNMIPELARRQSKTRCRTVLLQNVGLLFGFGAMLVIAVFEEHIRIA